MDAGGSGTSPADSRPLLILRRDTSRGDLPGLCHGLRRLCAFPWYEVDCDASALPADLASVDLLARLQLSLCAAGRRLRVVNASTALARLLALVGLAEVLLGLGVQPRRQAEHRKPACDVEEGVHRPDPPV